jgi:hypothetical protein
MLYLRSVQGCARLDCCRSEDIGQELKFTSIIANIDRYRKLRIDGSRVPKIASSIIPTVEGTWNFQEIDGRCEVGTGQVVVKKKKKKKRKKRETKKKRKTRKKRKKTKKKE